jgi:uroporphyrinogen decarboxylase
MSLREKFFNAMRRKSGGYIPYEFVLCPSLVDEFKNRTGADDYEEYYQFPVRTISVEYTGKPDKFAKYHQGFKGITIDRWGVGHRKGSIAHFSEMISPMREFETVEEFMEYPYTDPEKEYDWKGMRKKVKMLQENDLVVASNDIEETVFETSWYLRGMENFLIDMVINPELAHYQAERITEISCAFAVKLAEMGVDVLRLGDDVSTQLDMMMSVETWREYIKPRLARVIKTAKNIKPDIMVFYHGDGNLIKIIPELIDIGVDILNPVQPECVDPIKVKREFGSRLSFWGTLGTQTTMPFCTKEEVRDVCISMINEVGAGGGLLLAPTHMLEPEVPWDNIKAFVDTVNEYNSLNIAYRM